MELTLGEVSSSYRALQSLAKPENEMPIGAAVKVRRLIKALETDAQTAIDKQNELIKKHGKEHDGQISVSPEDVESFIAYLKDLQPIIEEKVEIELTPFPLKELGDKISISVSDLVALEKIITL